jgi:WD40 repeat protein
MRVALALTTWLAWSVLVGVAQEPLRPFGYGPLPPGAWACLGSPRFVGDKPAFSVAFSPDGKYLASGTRSYGLVDTDIHVWDLSTGEEVKILRGHARRIIALRFTPDGKKLISAAWDNTIRVWNLAGGKEERQFKGHEDVVTGLELSPDGKQLVSSSQDNTLRVWDFAGGKELRRMTCWASGISLAPDGRTLAAAAQVVLLWDIQTGKQLRQIGKAGVAGNGLRGVCYSPDGKTLAVLGQGGHVSLWDVAAGKELLSLQGLKRPALAMAFSPDGKVLATGGGGYAQPGVNFDNFLTEFKLWDVKSGKQLRSCEGHTYYVSAVAFSPKGETLASASEDFSVRLWDWRTGRELLRFTGHSQAITSLAYTPDARTLVSASADGTVRLWDAREGKEQAVLRGHTRAVRAIALGAGGKTLATGALDGTIRLWDLTQRREIRKLAADQGDVWCLAFSPDGRMLAWGDRGQAGSGGTVRFWDWRAGKELKQLEDQAGAHCLAFAPDGKTLAVGFHPEISVWEVPTGKVRERVPAHGERVVALGYLPDGKLVSGGGGDKVMMHAVRLWDPGAKLRLHEFGTGRGYHTTMAVSPDGRLVAGAFETSIQVWEASTRHKVGAFRGQRRHISALAFSPDGRTLASGGADGAILFWDLTGSRKGGPPADKPPTPAELNALWKQLAQDAGRPALWKLANSPKQAVPFLRQQLPIIPKVDPLGTHQLVAQLDAEKFTIRQKAMSELENLGEAAEPALRRALKDNPTPELDWRAKQLLKKLESKRQQESKRLPGSLVQILRAIEALEWAGTPEAVKVLRGIAEGEPSARQTREAQAALKRLTHLVK